MRSYHKFSSKLFMLTFRNICIIHEVAFNNILNLVTLIPNTDIRPIRHRNIDIPKINYITLSINLRQFRISNPFELIRAHIGFSFHCKYPPSPFVSFIYLSNPLRNEQNQHQGGGTNWSRTPPCTGLFSDISNMFKHVQYVFCTY